MWTRRLRLMWSTIAASVVLLPDPVAPVTRTRPDLRVASSVHASGSARPASWGMSKGTARNTPTTVPRWKNTLARKRATPDREMA